MEKRRDNNLDFLRTIGLFGIILAHVSPPNFMMQLRTFDVPLMVIVSGIAYGISVNNKSTTKYYKHRILRLLAPTWTFLVIYFLYFSIILYLIEHQTISIKIIINSFLLLNNGGIGYVWIVKVFILVAISTPIIDFINSKIKNSLLYYILIAICMITYFFLVNLIISNKSIYEYVFLNFILFEYIFYIIPYALIFATGLRLIQLSNKHIALFIVFLLFNFIVLLTVGSEHTFVNINKYKYPPQALWTIYGIMVSIILYFSSRYIKLNNSFNCFFTLISSSSMWIYLWHIFLLNNWGFGISHIPSFINNYIFKFFFFISLATFMTYTQKKILNYSLNRYEIPIKIKKFLILIFN